MPTSTKTPDQQSSRCSRCIQVGPTSAAHLSLWGHSNGTTKSRPWLSINVLSQYS
jgi:hypothetical protein